MNRRRALPRTASCLDAMALSLLSTGLLVVALWAIRCSQRVAQQPAAQGVMTFHLTRTGDLRLWNQPIRPQDVPILLQRAHGRSHGSSTRLLVRVIPEPEVPWGVIHGLLRRLQPTPPERIWTLQLQLP